MHLITTVISLLFSCCLWEVETRDVTAILSVSNGGRWGKWGTEEYCRKGYLDGFSVKMQEKGKRIRDKTGVIGIRGHCTDGSVITSSVGKGGVWSEEFSCWSGYLKAFSLQVSAPQGILRDDTAVNNIKFKCRDGSELEINGLSQGTYGEWSETCQVGTMCGIQTKVEKAKGLHVLDRTELNDVKFFCCS